MSEGCHGHSGVTIGVEIRSYQQTGEHESPFSPELWIVDETLL
jgi:hypothetical protein